jgi:hypothetical protein
VIVARRTGHRQGIIRLTLGKKQLWRRFSFMLQACNESIAYRFFSFHQANGHDSSLSRFLLPFVDIPARGGSVTLPSFLDLHAASFTVAANVLLSDLDSRNIILGSWGDGSWQLLFAVNAGGQPAISLRKDLPTFGSDPDQDLVNLSGTIALQPGSFQHVAVTFDWGLNFMAPKATLYVNGAEAGSVSPTINPDPRVRNPYTLMPTSNPYLLGRKQDSADQDSFFQGQLSDFRIYTRALTQADIQALLS